MTWLLLLILLFLAASTLAYQGRDTCDQWNRVAWCWTGILILEAWWLPNHWVGALLALVTLGCAPPFAQGEKAAQQNYPNLVGSLFIYPRHEMLEQIALPAGVLALAYTVLVGLLIPEMMIGILVALVLLGQIVGLWAVYSKVGAPTEKFQRQLWRFLWVHDESRVCPRAGQGNGNHAQAVAALAIAACYGLSLALSPWWLFALPIPLCAIALCHDGRSGWLNQGIVHTVTATLALGSLALVPVVGGWAWSVLVFPVMFAVSKIKPWREQPVANFDSGRLRLWRETLKDLWWPHGWRVRLLGFGTGSWRMVTPAFTVSRFNRVVFTTAHNEYVEMLFEHGAVGLFLLFGLIGTFLWQAWSGGPLGHALLIVELTLCSIAVTNFPWTFFHTINEPQPYAYAAMAQSASTGPQGMAMQICKSQQELKTVAVVMAQHGLTPTYTAWVAGQPMPMLLTHEELHTLELDKTPKWVGSPALVALSFVIAAMAGAV